MSYEVTRRVEWDMAHRIPRHGGNCQHLHGHRYSAEITCRSADLDEVGVVVDFAAIKGLVGRWIDDHWDHNTVYQAGDPFMEALARTAEEAWCGDVSWRRWYEMGDAPTAENLARKIYDVATNLLRTRGIAVVRVDLWETPNCWARYEPQHGSERA